MNAPIDLLVLDAHGVIIQQRFHVVLARVAEIGGLDPAMVLDRWKTKTRDRAWLTATTDTQIWHELGFLGDSEAWNELLIAHMRPGQALDKLAQWSDRQPIWLLTNHRNSWIEAILQSFNCRSHFTTLLTSQDIARTKPDPEAFRAISSSGISPSRICFVDDTTANIQTAKDLGFQTYHAVPWKPWASELDRLIMQVGCSA